MRRTAHALLVLEIMFTCLAWSPDGSSAQVGQGIVDAEALKAGDKWVYKRASGGEYEVSVTDVVAGEYVTAVSSLPGVKFYRETVTRLEGKLERGDPRNFVGWKWLDFPIGPGKNFSYQTDSSFGAVDVDAETWAPCGQLRWYSPEVGTFIKQLSPRQSFGQMADFDFELVSLYPWSLT